MLSVLTFVLSVQSAFAGGSPHPTTEYDHCKVAVLVDWGHQQAWASQVTTKGEIDNNSRLPLTLSDFPRSSSGSTPQKAPLPFDSAFEQIVFVGQQQVYGQMPTKDPSQDCLMQGTPMYEARSAESTKDLYMIDAGPNCNQ